MSWKQWENKAVRDAWNSAIDSMEKTAKAFASEHASGADVSRCHQDSPDVILRWQDGPTSRNLQFIIQSENWPLSVAVLGHAWRDAGDRIFKSHDFGTVSYADPEALASAFPADLASAFEQSRSINLASRASGD